MVIRDAYHVLGYLRPNLTNSTAAQFFLLD